MKKLIRNIALLLLPILLYYGVFIAFEPNNYFGLKAEADGTDIMAALRLYQQDPVNAIILGDSRVAKLDTGTAAALTGRPYANLSYGGASVKEQLDLVDWALALNPNLEEVVFSLSFYTLNAAYNHDRKVIAALNNPLAYMTNLGYNINMLTNLSDHLAPGRTVGDSGETMDPADYKMVPYEDPLTGQTLPVREKIAEHLQNLLPNTRGWRLNTEQTERLLETIDTCRERGVRFVVVLPPMHDAVMDLLVRPLGIDEGMQPLLTALQNSPATLLDYEFHNRGAFADDQFFDGLHLDEQRGLPAFTALLFETLAHLPAPSF